MFYQIYQYTPSEDVDYEDPKIKEHLELMLDKENGFPSGYACFSDEGATEEMIISALAYLLNEKNIKLEEYDIFEAYPSWDNFEQVPKSKRQRITKAQLEKYIKNF